MANDTASKPVTVGAHVQVVSGPNKGLAGIVEVHHENEGVVTLSGDFAGYVNVLRADVKNIG